MLERNIKIKPAPEQWQAERNLRFHLVVTFEARVFDAIYEGAFPLPSPNKNQVSSAIRLFKPQFEALLGFLK